MNIILADNQDITRAGLLYVFEQIGVENVVTATDKAALLDKLRDNPCSVHSSTLVETVSYLFLENVSRMLFSCSSQRNSAWTSSEEWWGHHFLSACCSRNLP